MRGKRLLSILLVAALAIMPVSSTVYADEPDTSVQETAQEEMVTDATYEEPFGETADGDASEEEQPGEAVEEVTKETIEEAAPGESTEETQPGEGSEEEQSGDGSEEVLPEETSAQARSVDDSENKQPSEDDKEAKPEVGNEAGAPEEDKSGEESKSQDQSASDTDKGNEKEKETAKNEPESDEQEGFEYSEKVDGYVITLTAADDVIPDGVKVVIERLNEKEDTEEIAGAIGEEISTGREIVEIIAFDISFYLDDKPFEPEEGTVNVSIMLDEDMDKTLKETEEGKGSYEIAVYHIDEEDEKLKAEEVECELTEENEVVFDAEKFSPYAIVLTAGDGYTVEFDGNDAMGGSMEDMDCYSGTRYKLTKNAYTRRGYTFKEWNTEYDGSGDKYADEADFRNLDEKYGSYITLYAQWIPNKYTVRFDGNGSTSGSMNDMTGCKYDQDYTLTSNAYKRKGFAFTGWNTKADGSGTAYANKEEVSNLSHKNGAVVTLYARWKRSTYTITYELNGGKNNASNPATYNVSTATITLQDPTRTGYTFGGWFSDSEYKTKVTEIKKGSTGNRTLYAKWTVNKYTIRFNGNGATSGSMKDLTGCRYGKSYNLTANAFKRKGYKFTGWNTKADGSGTAFADRADVTSLSKKNGAVVTLYARWKRLNYTITYNLNGGKNNSANPATYNVSTATITLKNPSRTGYTFGGWFSDSEYKTKVTEIKKGSTGNKTLYAKWTRNKYAIRFNGNGSTSGSMNDMTGCKYGTAYNLTANAFKRTGYTFAGWNTKADGSGTAYANKAEVKNLTAKNGVTITLYARWSPIKYTIRFSGNGNTSGSMEDMSCKYGKSYTLTANGFSKTNYKFKGWNTKANGKGTAYANAASVKNLTATNGGTITLYAQWTENFKKISLGYTSPSQSSIRSFISSHPLSYDKNEGINTYKKKPSLKEPYSAGQLSSSSLNSSLNALNTYRYIVGLPSNVRLNSTYSDKAAKATLLCTLNGYLSHTPERPSQLRASKYDTLYNDGYDGASHSNIAYRGGSWYQAEEEAVDSWMNDTDSYNISALGHRRWILDPGLSQVGFGQTIRDVSDYSHESYNAVYIIEDGYTPYSNKTYAWPAVNTPVSHFLADPLNKQPAWSLSTGGRYVYADKVKVKVKRTSDGKTWNFSSSSADGYFNVNNGSYGEPGCVIFQPKGLTVKAGEKYEVTVYFYDTYEMLTYTVNFF